MRGHVPARPVQRLVEVGPRALPRRAVDHIQVLRREAQGLLLVSLRRAAPRGGAAVVLMILIGVGDGQVAVRVRLA